MLTESSPVRTEAPYQRGRWNRGAPYSGPTGRLHHQGGDRYCKRNHGEYSGQASSLTLPTLPTLSQHFLNTSLTLPSPGDHGRRPETRPHSALPCAPAHPLQRQAAIRVPSRAGYAWGGYGIRQSKEYPAGKNFQNVLELYLNQPSFRSDQLILGSNWYADILPGFQHGCNSVTKDGW